LSDKCTQLVGLIGWPVKHSLSPAMHNAAFNAVGIHWQYVPLPVAPQRLATAISGLAALGFRGANVTVPHKERVIPLLDRASPLARTLGAANTLVVESTGEDSTSISGDNTDPAGFIAALEHGGYELKRCRKAVVVGAGGAARAVVYALIQRGVNHIAVLNRTPERAKILVSSLNNVSKNQTRLEAFPFLEKELIAQTNVADLFINATTLGMWPDTEASVWPEWIPIPRHLTVFDLIYRPQETRLIRQARKGGAMAIGGQEMLVRQGALSFERWTGMPAPIRVMRAACEDALKAQQEAGIP